MTNIKAFVKLFKVFQNVYIGDHCKVRIDLKLVYKPSINITLLRIVNVL